MKILVVLVLRSFIYYVINVYVPRVRANAYHTLTTLPRVFKDPNMCLRNIWTAPNVNFLNCDQNHTIQLLIPEAGYPSEC